MTERDAMIERLRGQKTEYESDQFSQGREAGIEWAREDADYEELLRLVQVDRDTLDWQLEFEWPTIAGEIIYAELRQTDFAAGFANGAIEEFEAIQSQLG